MTDVIDLPLIIKRTIKKPGVTSFVTHCSVYATITYTKTNTTINKNKNYYGYILSKNYHHTSET